MTSIGIIGHTCSGKSTVSKLVSSKTGVPIASFGKYLLEYSRLREMPTDKPALQNLGDKFIQEAPCSFLKNVISSTVGNSDKILFEGIRHLSILNSIIDTSTKTCFFFLDVPILIRYNRYCSREKIDNFPFESFQKMEEHNVESEIPILASYCNMRLLYVESQTPEDIACIIHSEMENLML